MPCALSRPMRSLLLLTALAALGGCQTKHSPGFAKLRPERTAAAAAPPAARALPEGTAEGVPEHLLHEYTGRDLAPTTEIGAWDLPAKSKRLVVELLVHAAADTTANLRELMTEQARWGVPDRRELDARPVFDGDDGRVFLDTLRGAASRFGRKENLNCPPIMPPAAQTYVRNGSEPMWCFYSSNDGLDILAFKLVLEGGGAKVDYVGMHPDRPTGMILRPGPPPPPMTPMVRRTPGTRPMPEGPEGLGMPGGQPMIVGGQPDAAVGAPGQPPGPVVGTPLPPAEGAAPGNPTQPIAPANPGTLPSGTAPANPGTPPRPSGTVGEPAARPAQAGSDSSATPHP